MARRSKAFWQELLEKYSDRNCSQEEFCKEHGITPGTLQYHLKKMSSCQESAKSQFIPVAVASPHAGSHIVIELPHGIRLSIPQ